MSHIVGMLLSLLSWCHMARLAGPFAAQQSPVGQGGYGSAQDRPIPSPFLLYLIDISTSPDRVEYAVRRCM
jgi:hypothetical protein